MSYVNSTNLAVFVDSQLTGELVKTPDEFVFNYSSKEPSRFISLTMPVRAKSYVHPVMHPIFEMHLPEGYLLAIIKKHFAKLTATDDFGLLMLLSASVRGRIHYSADLRERGDVLSLDDLLHPKGATLFDELVSRFALKSPLSGVQPKVLAQIENKATLKVDDYIVKAWGEDYPELAINEYFCMRAVMAAGIAVPTFYLSDDDRYFIMNRFDLLDSGDALGFEDMCVLQAKKRDDKYSGSYEQIAKTIKTFTSARYKNSSLQQFFKMVVMNNLLQNGDAHLKNFGLLYRSIDQVWLAPAYDVVSTTAYIKSDIAALNLLGSKRWHNRKNLIRFGLEACDLSAKQAKNLFDECLNAMEVMGVEVRIRLDKEANIEKQKVLKHLLALSGVCRGQTGA